jgi:acyl-CoA thioester hydrolase
LDAQPKTARVVPRPEQFAGLSTDTIRFGDLDPQGHVNNTVFSTYFETGRVMFLREPDNMLSPPGSTSVLARLDVNFLKELHWPGTVEIGTATAGIGRSSYTFMQAIFHAGGCAATARATMVLIDMETRRARPLPVQMIERLEAFRMRE